MLFSKNFVELNKDIHDRDSFDCGEKELNDFIKTKASKHMELGISRTVVLPSLEPLINGKYEICSFYTIVPSSISRENLPSNLAKKLPFYPIPVFLLAELAVNSKYHGQGLGKITLIKALKFALEVNTFMKGYAVIVDCLNQSAEDFYLKYDFEKLLKYEGRTRMFLSMKTIEMLFHE